MRLILLYSCSSSSPDWQSRTTVSSIPHWANCHSHTPSHTSPFTIHPTQPPFLPSPLVCSLVITHAYAYIIVVSFLSRLLLSSSPSSTSRPEVLPDPMPL